MLPIWRALGLRPNFNFTNSGSFVRMQEIKPSVLDNRICYKDHNGNNAVFASFHSSSQVGSECQIKFLITCGKVIGIEYNTSEIGFDNDFQILTINYTKGKQFSPIGISCRIDDKFILCNLDYGFINANFGLH